MAWPSTKAVRPRGTKRILDFIVNSACKRRGKVRVERGETVEGCGSSNSTGRDALICLFVFSYPLDNSGMIGPEHPTYAIRCNSESATAAKGLGRPRRR